MKISCVIPAHNEEGNIEELIEGLVSVLESHDMTKDYEIILVNDNSTDEIREQLNVRRRTSERIVT